MDNAISTYTVIDGTAYPITETKDVYRAYTLRRGLYSIVQVSTGAEICTARGKGVARRRLDAVRAARTDDIDGLRALVSAVQ